jgi:hypothetical protein
LGRGILPVVAVLAVASLYSQFVGTSPPSPMIYVSPQAKNDLQNSNRGRTRAVAGEAMPGGLTRQYCKDPFSCLPRSDVGPWSTSCDFARSVSTVPDRSPLVALNLATSLNHQLEDIAASNNARPISNSTDDSALRRWCLDSQVAITPVIVTVPDPLSSHLDIDFDRRVDALESAALDSGYILDHFWLPWVGTQLEASSNPNRTYNERALAEVKLKEPGLEVFRSKDSHLHAAVFLFFVGETPTSGINLIQLEKALTYSRQVQIVTGGPPSPIKFLGPSFSGSVPAFLGFLQRRTETFDIIATSATDNGFLQQLREGVGTRGRVRTVLHDDSVALERFVIYAKDVLRVAPRDIAIISESQTAFGQFVAASSESPPGSHFSIPQDPCPDEGLRFCVEHFSFPREIYRLRAVYPDQKHVSAANSQRSDVPGTGLEVNLKFAPGGEDGIPPFSAEQLPLSQEASLLAIATTLREHKTKLAGVAATDVFDSLFVLRFLRELCPDTRLFILDSDLLFIRAADNLSLHGTLAVTDYPLSMAIESWERGDNSTLDDRWPVRYQSFPSRNAEGTYNAFLALLGQSDRMLDYWQQVPSDTSETTTATQTQLWLTVISRNGFEPVHLLRAGQNEPASLPFVEGPKRKLQVRPLPSGGYLLLVGLLAGITFIHLLVAHLAFAPQAKFGSWMLEFFHICCDSSVRTQKAYFLATVFVVLAVMDFMVFLPVWALFLFRHPATSTWYDLICALTLAVCVGAMVHAMWLCARHDVFLNKEGGWMALSWIVAICYYAAWFHLTCKEGDDSLLFLHRSLQLASGTSPLLPHFLLLVAFYLWAISNLRRVHVWETRRQTMEFSALDKHYSAGFAQIEDDINNYFGDLFSYKNLTWLVIFVIFSTVLFRPLSHIAGFEPFKVGSFNGFDLLFVVYWLLFIAMLFGMLLRFAVAWAAVLKILRRLERQPIRRAFDRLPKKFYSWTPLWHSGGARRTYSLQTRELECLQKLKHSSSPPLPVSLRRDLPGLVNQLQTSASRLLDAESKYFLDLQYENLIWQQNLVSTGDRILFDFLVPYWNTLGHCESVEQHEQEQSMKPDPGIRHLIHNRMPFADPAVLPVIAEEFIALRIVAFLRYVGVQLRNVLSFVVAGFVLAVASIRSYPFLAHRTIGWSLTLIFVAIGIPVVIAFAQMDKDAVLSRLSDTDPGKLDRAFYIRLLAYGGVPLLTVLASQFPALGRFLFSWIQPAVEALH